MTAIEWAGVAVCFAGVVVVSGALLVLGAVVWVRALDFALVALKANREVYWLIRLKVSGDTSELVKALADAKDAIAAERNDASEAYSAQRRASTWARAWKRAAKSASAQATLTKAAADDEHD